MICIIEILEAGVALWIFKNGKFLRLIRYILSSLTDIQHHFMASIYHYHSFIFVNIFRKSNKLTSIYYSCSGSIQPYRKIKGLVTKSVRSKSLKRYTNYSRKMWVRMNMITSSGLWFLLRTSYHDRRDFPFDSTCKSVAENKCWNSSARTVMKIARKLHTAL